MKVKVNTNTLFTLVQNPNIYVIFAWCTAGSFFVFTPNFGQLASIRDPLQLLTQPILYVPFILTALVYAVAVKKNVHFDRISNNVYIQSNSILKQDQKQISFMQIASVEGIERAGYVKNKVQHYYFDIYLNLKDGTSQLVGSSGNKYSEKERELNPVDPLITQISTFLGVPHKTTRINYEELISTIPISDIKVHSFLKPLINKAVLVQKNPDTRIYINKNVNPQDQAELRKFTEHLAMNLSRKPIETQTNKIENTFSNFEQSTDTSKPIDPFSNT